MKSTQVRKYVRAITPTCAAMQSVCQPLNRLGIDYLSYTRIYNNGERFFLAHYRVLLKIILTTKDIKKFVTK